MPSCVIKWCGKSSKTSNRNKDGITFHRFPTECPRRKSEWIEATRRGEEWFPSKTSVICSRHFTEDNFILTKNSRRLLMDTAMPTLYLPILAPTPQTTSSKSLAENHETTNNSPTRDRLEPPVIEPSAYNSPVEKRLWRRIIHLNNIVKTKKHTN